MPVDIVNKGKDIAAGDAGYTAMAKQHIADIAAGKTDHLGALAAVYNAQQHERTGAEGAGHTMKIAKGKFPELLVVVVCILVVVIIVIAYLMYRKRRLRQEIAGRSNDPVALPGAGG